MSEHHRRPGALIAIGGSEDKTGPSIVLGAVLGAAATPRPVVAVCASASEIADERVTTYRHAFTRLGAGEVRDITATDPQAAHDPALAAAALAADVVFLTGGSQLRLLEILAGSPLAAAIRAAHTAGAVVGGTSAGASALASLMPLGDAGALGAGIGLVDGVVIDQHFTERARIGRLARAVADQPATTGIGIDEDTAAFLSATRPDRARNTPIDGAPAHTRAVTRTRVVRVVGRGSVTVLAPGREPLVWPAA